MIKTVLFDVDGVLLSEERYFDMSALTVWEVLHSNNYLGLGPEKFKTDYSDEEIAEIRATVFDHDRVLKFLKGQGLNANWDMIYLTVSYQLLRLLEQVKDEQQENIEKWLTNEINREVLLEIGQALKGKQLELDFLAFIGDFQDAEATKQGLLDHLDFLAKKMLGVETDMFGKKDELWSTCEHTSQEWYVGDEHVLSSTGRPSVQTGKKGFMNDEKTLNSPEKISELFQSLNDAGIRIGIGTGRPGLETIEPFKQLNWLKYFDVNYIAHADDVLEAERNHPEAPALAKPHPFTYLLALSGKTKTAKECLETKLPIENANEVLIVGDSLADLIAAREMGCVFAAILTGLSGQDARAEFEEHKADYIFDNVVDIKEILL